MFEYKEPNWNLINQELRFYERTVRETVDIIRVTEENIFALAKGLYGSIDFNAPDGSPTLTFWLSDGLRTNYAKIGDVLTVNSKGVLSRTTGDKWLDEWSVIDNG